MPRLVKERSPQMTSPPDIGEFAFRAAHDLKRPLLTFESFLQLLRTDIEASDRSKIEEDLIELERAAGQMRSLITELLELSRIGRLDLCRVSTKAPHSEIANLQEIVDDLATSINSSEPQVRFEIPVPLPALRVHPTLIRELFNHLFENSVHHSSPQSDLKIEVTYKETDDFFEFYLADNGPGIPAADRERVFDWYVQLSDRSSGVGIGLAICRKIIERHQGEIRIEDRADQAGCLVCFSIERIE